MSRDDGFAIADTDTGLHTDPKVRKLWRRLDHSDAMSNCMTLYEGIRLTSWAKGERVTAEDAAPFWMRENVGIWETHLKYAGLLDEDGLIPLDTWEKWFGVARDRRQHRRDAGYLGGRPANHMVSNGKQTVSNTNPVRPSVPTVPSDRIARERLESGEFTTYAEAIEAVRAGK